MRRREFLTTTLSTTLGSAFASKFGSGFALGAGTVEGKWRVAVIGHTGHGDYGHGLDTVWFKVPETEIVGVADADAVGLEKAKQKLKVERGFADYRQMLGELKPDLVAVAPRYVDEHRDMMLAAIAAGAKGIYVEKPFCRTPEEADEIVAAADARGVKIALAHRNRYHPVLPVVQRLVKEGAIGRLLELRARGKEDARGGALDLWVLGAHLLNLIVYFAGEPRSCSAVLLQDGRPITHDDVKEGAEGVGPIAGNELHARYETASGVPAFFDSVANAATNFGLQFIGTKGIIDLRLDVEPLAQLLAGNPFLPSKEPRTWVPISSAGIGQPEPIADIKDQIGGHLAPVRDLMAAVREDRQPLCGAHDGRTIVEMIMAAFESHRLGGQRVAFPLQARQNPLAAI